MLYIWDMVRTSVDNSYGTMSPLQPNCISRYYYLPIPNSVTKVEIGASTLWPAWWISTLCSLSSIMGSWLSEVAVDIVDRQGRQWRRLLVTQPELQAHFFLHNKLLSQLLIGSGAMGTRLGGEGRGTLKHKSNERADLKYWGHCM